jgi:NADPH:quinone reductase-like Zn-dependent oxidoreductase
MPAKERLMSQQIPTSGLQLQSKVSLGGELEISLAKVAVAPPQSDEILVRMEAAPLNPSDLALLFAGADMRAARAEVGADGPVVKAQVPERALGSLAARLGVGLPVGNEGAGTIVATGDSDAAKALLGRRVAVAGGAMYAQFRTVKARDAMVLPQGASARDGASSFVNPLTALGMLETMRQEGHTALVHTAAASNLGQMLNRICLADGVELVNVVRSPAQVALLRDQGARHIVDSTSDTFLPDLAAAVAQTGATLAFDAIGGGRLLGQILTAMEQAAVAQMGDYSRYGSNTFKQGYIYGGLDMGPTELSRSYGFAWAIGAWLLTPFLQRIGPDAVARLRQRVSQELTTTFASHYQQTLSLSQALDLENIAAYARRATGEKYLIAPSD